MFHTVDALYIALYAAHCDNNTISIRYFYGLNIPHTKVSAYMPVGIFTGIFANAYCTPKYSHIAAYTRVNISRFVKPRPL